MEAVSPCIQQSRKWKQNIENIFKIVGFLFHISRQNDTMIKRLKISKTNIDGQEMDAMNANN